MLATIFLLVSSAMAVGPHIENAVTIHTATRDYLEFDIAPLSPCSRPIVKSLSLRGARTALVDWTLPVIVMDTLCQEKTTRANAILPFPDSVGAARGPILVLDSVVDLFTGNVVINIGRVVNPLPPVLCPALACRIYDSATAFQMVKARIHASSFVATFAPYIPQSLVPISPWSPTTGLENFPEVALPLSGNVGNWIREEVRQMEMDSLVAGTITSPCPPGQVCPLYLVVLPNVRLPTGPVQYFYQQATDPFQGDTSSASAPFVQDTVLKIGPRLHLSGYVNHGCWTPLVDSNLINVSRWLVASNGSTSDSLFAAFQLPWLCGYLRPGAWPFRNGLVEITPGIWVPLQDLQGPVGVLPRTTRVAGPSLRRVGQAADLELPAPALVRAIDISGREIMPETGFDKGRHALSLPRNHSMLFVQIRTGISTITLPLEPIR